MASLEAALPTVLAHEGGYGNDPTDRGGETFRGISRKHHPDWPGWAQVDAARQFSTFPECLLDDPALTDSVRAFYRAKFWSYDGVADQGVATKLFDTAVNTGPYRMAVICQTALNRLGERLRIDGELGPLTLLAVNRADPERLLKEFRVEQALFYARLCFRNSSQLKFLRGWLHRALAS